MKDVFIVSGARTPIGSFGGRLKNTSVVDLGATVLKAVLHKTGLKPVSHAQADMFYPTVLKGAGRIALEDAFYDYNEAFLPVRIDEVIMGNVIGTAQGQNIARQSSLKSGIGKETPAYTVNKVCGSGMKAVTLAYQSIKSGDSDIILAGGMENMSMIPYAQTNARWGSRMGDVNLVDIMILDGLYEKFYNYHMGVTAENIAKVYHISREEQDEFALLSYQRALTAISTGKLKDEIVPVAIDDNPENPLMLESDERPMPTSLSRMARLTPEFEEQGTITAGNASGIADGAAALLLISENKARELDLNPLVRIKDCVSVGLDPAFMGLSPIPAVKKLLSKHQLSITDFDLIELNEAFSSSTLACAKELGADIVRINALGGSIAYGHPIGCSGARIILTLMYQMAQNNYNLGLATICIGGGQGMAIILERA